MKNIDQKDTIGMATRALEGLYFAQAQVEDMFEGKDLEEQLKAISFKIEKAHVDLEKAIKAKYYQKKSKQK